MGDVRRVRRESLEETDDLTDVITARVGPTGRVLRAPLMSQPRRLLADILQRYKFGLVP